MARSRPRPQRAPRLQPSAVAGTSWWDRLSSRAQHLICAALLVGVAFGFFAPVHFGGRSLVGGDTVSWRAMAEGMIEAQQATGERVLWSPNAFAGMPGYMVNYDRPVPQVGDLFEALRGLLWPTSHFLLLLAGAYLLVVFLTRDKLAAVLAALAYGLTTYLSLILVAGHNSKYIALAWAPWLVLAFAYALRRPRLLSGLLFAVALAANLQAGHVQITYYVAFFLGLWWIVEGVGALRAGRLPAFGKATAFLAVGSVLALLMVASPYLVYAEYKGFTIRGGAGPAGAGGEGLDWAYAMRWSQGFGELVTLLIADAYGGSALYWGPKPFTGGPHYAGALVVALALIALVRVRRPVVYALGGGVVLMMLFSLGEHLPALNRLMFEVFPLFSSFRVPETWLSVVVLLLAVLAGFGLAAAAARTEAPEEGRRTTRAVLGVVGGLVAFVLLLWVARGAFFDFQRPGEAEALVQQVVQQRPDLDAADPQLQQAVRQEVARRVAERDDAFSGDALRTLLFLLLGGALLGAYRFGKLPSWALHLGLALLVTVDLWGVGRRYFGEEHLVPESRAQALIPEYGFDRWIKQQVAATGGPGHFRVLSLEAGDPTTNARPAYHYQTLNGYHGAKLRLFQDYIEHVFVDPATGLPNENALDLLNTRYVVAPGTLPGLEPVYQDEQTGMVVSENPDAVPRAFFVGETEVVADPEAAWQRLRDPAFDPRRTALLAEPLDGFATTPLDSAATATATLERYTPDEIVWRVQTDAPRLLVVSEVYYPAGWTATLDGAPVPIVRADYLLRAVPVPPGEHTLVMRFAPAREAASVWISALATLLTYGGVLALLGLAFYRRRRRRRPADAA